MQRQHNLSKDTAAIQSALALVCRTGAITELPGTTSAERVTTYRSLIHGNFEDTLARAYPVTKKTLTAKRWNEMVDGFVSSHPSKSPQLWQMPEEFCRFAIAAGYSQKFDAPFLDDLMKFEWIEIEVFMMEDLNPPQDRLGSNFVSGKLVVNQEHRTLTVQYPVFEPTKSGFSRRKGVFRLITFRNPRNLQVEYMIASPLVLALLAVLMERPRTLRKALELACKETRVENTGEMLSAARGLVSDLAARGMILGTVN